MAVMPTPEVIAEISALKAHYFHALDGKRWDEMTAVFSNDAQFEGFAFDSPGREGFITAVAAFLADVRSQHQGSMPRFDQLADGRVRALWPMHDYLTWPQDGRPYKGIVTPGQYGLRGWGYYEEECALTPDGWRIAFSRLTRTRIDALTASGAVTVEYDVTAPDPTWIS